MVYFGLEKHHLALTCVNEALQNPISLTFQLLYSLFRLLNLPIHFELGNHDYLLYELRSVERKFRLQKKLYQTEKVLIRFFKQLLQKSTKAKTADWQLLHEQLLTLAEYPWEKQILSWFDFVSWAASKKQNFFRNGGSAPGVAYSKTDCLLQSPAQFVGKNNFTSSATKLL